MSLASMELQIDNERERVRQLEGEKAGLEQFLAQVRTEESRFAQQLQGKRQAGSRARSIARSKAARGLASMIDSRLDGGFSSGVSSCYQGVCGNARAAIDQVEQEIRQARNRIAGLEQDMANERRRLAQEEEARRKEELERSKSEREGI